MIAQRISTNQYETSNEDGTHKHIVTPDSCDCMDFRMRKARLGINCKHMDFIKTLDMPVQEQPKVNNTILEFIKKHGNVKYSDLTNNFSNLNIDNELELLISKGEVLHNKRNDSYMVM